jgi:hypothetical protein
MKSTRQQQLRARSNTLRHGSFVLCDPRSINKQGERPRAEVRLPVFGRFEDAVGRAREVSRTLRAYSHPYGSDEVYVAEVDVVVERSLDLQDERDDRATVRCSRLWIVRATEPPKLQIGSRPVDDVDDSIG